MLSFCEAGHNKRTFILVVASLRSYPAVPENGGLFPGPEALKGIETSINDFYRTTYPGLFSSKKETINAAVKSTQEAFLKNIFPAMKVKWSDYPNGIGHFIFRGCMRCHDGKHKGEGGTSIPHDCNTCHIILEQGKTGHEETLNLELGLDFKHPSDIGSAWKETGCYECHRGIQP